MNEHSPRLLGARRTLSAPEKRDIKKRGVLLSGLGFLLLLAVLVVYRYAGITGVPWRRIAWAGAGTAGEVGLLWWIVHAGWDERLSWDPDFIYVPLGGAVLLLGGYLLAVPEARDVVLVAWFVALLFGAGLLRLRGVMYLGTLMTVIYVGIVALHAHGGVTVEPAREAIRIGLLVGMHGFAGLVFRRLRRSREEKRGLRRELHREAVTDPLTGLYNRRFLMERLRSEVDSLDRYGGACSVIMLDLDYFKRYNDTYGHVAGDEVLEQLAEVCRTEARDADVVARYGGEEFTVVLPDTSWREALDAAERIRKAVESAAFEDEQVLPRGRLTVSLGVAGYPEHAETADRLIQMADRALYRAKEAGRNCVRVVTESQPSFRGLESRGAALRSTRRS